MHGDPVDYTLLEIYTAYPITRHALFKFGFLLEWQKYQLSVWEYFFLLECEIKTLTLFTLKFLGFCTCTKTKFCGHGSHLSIHIIFLNCDIIVEKNCGGDVVYLESIGFDTLGFEEVLVGVEGCEFGREHRKFYQSVLSQRQFLQHG